MDDTEPHDAPQPNGELRDNPPRSRSRAERRQHKRQLHDAQQKARALEKSEDRRTRRQEKKNRKDIDMAAKKADKGMAEKSEQKAEKVRRRQQKR